MEVLRASTRWLNLQATIDAMAAAWDDGCPVAGPEEKVARVALRRWRSHANWGIADTDLDRRAEDLAKGLVQAREKNPKLVGPLIEDYRHLARCIARVLDSRSGARDDG